MRLSPHTAQHLWSFSMDFHEASVPISPAPQCIPRGQLARSLGTFGPVFPQARGLRLQSSSWCTRLSRAPTIMPLPTSQEGIGFSSGSRLPTSTILPILPGISRVPIVGLNQDDVGGVFLGAPSALCGSRDCSQGRIRFTCDALLARSLFARSGPHPSRTTRSFGSLADISGKVCQGLHYP